MRFGFRSDAPDANRSALRGMSTDELDGFADQLLSESANLEDTHAEIAVYGHGDPGRQQGRLARADWLSSLREDVVAERGNRGR